MKLATFLQSGAERIGVVEGEFLVDLAQADPSLPREMTAFLEAGAEVLQRARRAAASADRRIALADVRLLAPVPRPRKFLAVGLNYADHAAETGRGAPSFPIIFNKQVSCVHPPFDDVVRPRVSVELDYEGELGFVMGKRCRSTPRERAAEAIAGYVVVNDVSVRDWQKRAPTMTLGKSFDTHGPMGPWITTADEVGDPHRLELETWVNGELRQHSNTSNLIFDCYALVEILSTAFTLEPGDVVTTGTPSGVGMVGSRWLVPGDVVRIEIERLGAIEHRVVDDEGSAAEP